jgi:hypothetical protein
MPATLYIPYDQTSAQNSSNTKKSSLLNDIQKLLAFLNRFSRRDVTISEIKITKQTPR